ncbi:MAG: cyclic nucleotide-binding domain-containing protein [Verrucomicrobiota bacterium]
MAKRGHIQLPAIGILDSLDDTALEKLSEFGHSLRMTKGEVAVEQGERQDSLFVILEGRMEVTRVKGESELVIGVIKRGESFGEMSIIDPAKASATVRAIEPVLLWRIRRGDLDDFILRNPDRGLRLMWKISALLVERLRFLDKSVADFALEKLKEEK